MTGTLIMAESMSHGRDALVAAASSPSHVKPGVSYGLNVHAAVAYLGVAPHVPFKRLQCLLKDLYGIEPSHP
ncbi:hypothetical protein D7V78_03500 [Parabacteroides distasonis]|uniref:Uncharacterized protein n=2 Tax=Parabacteroides distasonis TaxID=823 RepID=A0A3L7ZS48_PARDI|nr:hypothetical protein D7V78_03500 [Parabacteroides distasonis]